ncbi:MAG: hypothetical protein A2452_08550 [Candidatus Firestonebacteria bacterium RIFOXYC2_FULL_39_67]|nr:MAG: hypothetical protein A2536_05535 [Candidatus Firestonebacteria bacterium RIFOXYD2_FULL_39_29]OGF54932.1 MAG: hypothetical protein A2497_07340 [Candidatus Firestonebacteria bacterium RifOxyC12_full_39_7]OGF56963.1 MAG: hypothetical protein A2452_08550 [Candidatus Firestonebacteria bacterium RIFOXYC2_FULL_39_67]
MYLKKFKNGILLDRKTSINLELGLVKKKKDQLTALGLHLDEEEVYIVLKGKGRLLLGKKYKNVGPGTVVYVPAGVPHQFKALSNDFEYIYAATWPEELKKKKGSRS